MMQESQSFHAQRHDIEGNSLPEYAFGCWINFKITSSHYVS